MSLLFNQRRSAATRQLYTRAVLPPAILACSSSGTPAKISERIFRDWGKVDSLCGLVRTPHYVVDANDVAQAYAA
jgi:hypothetical protein